MVYHANPQPLVKLCDGGMQFLQVADEVVDNMLDWYKDSSPIFAIYGEEKTL